MVYVRAKNRPAEGSPTGTLNARHVQCSTRFSAVILMGSLLREPGGRPILDQALLILSAIRTATELLVLLVMVVQLSRAS